MGNIQGRMTPPPAKMASSAHGAELCGGRTLLEPDGHNPRHVRRHCAIPGRTTTMKTIVPTSVARPAYATKSGLSLWECAVCHVGSGGRSRDNRLRHTERSVLLSYYPVFIRTTTSEVRNE